MRTNHLAVFAALAAPFASALEVVAETASPFEAYFGAGKDGLTCWARTYDMAHLDSHPEQKTESIAIDVARTKTSGEANTPESFEIGFALKVRTRPDWYGQAGVCKAEGEGFSCFLEGDGGLFHLSPEGPDALRLKTGDYGISIEGGQDFVTLDGKTGDDKVFVLSRSKAECDAANAFFTQPSK